MIAGFESPDEGSIFIGDENITHLPSNQRRVNTVFQNYALFPHMNVFENVAYSLRIKNLDNELVKYRVQKFLKQSVLNNKCINRFNSCRVDNSNVLRLHVLLSTSQKYFLDEPLAAFDVKLREHMLIELMDLQETIKTTFVYVTHDQVEALTLADRMAIMNYDGEIEQVGTPQEIYEFLFHRLWRSLLGKQIFLGYFTYAW